MDRLLKIFLLVLLTDGSYMAVIPKPSEVAKMSRYIMHNVDWISIATISTISAIKNYPFVNLKSVSDGPTENSTGIPYLLMTDMDLSGKDVLVDNRVTIMASLAEVEFCKNQGYDPQDPRCGRLILTGKLKKVQEKTDEHEFAKNALFARHPAMKEWVKVHSFYIAYIDIEQIVLLDFFGGAKYVKIEDYFHAKLESRYRISDIIRTNENRPLENIVIVEYA